MKHDLRSIYQFVVVADEMSFTRAAQRLGIAQPWLSQRIRALEDQLGAPLFVRTTRRLELTKAGLLLLAAAKPLDEIVTEIAIATRSLRRGETERLRIGGPPYGSKIAVRNELLRLLQAHHRQLPMDMEVGWSPHLSQRVRDGELDAAFVVSPIEEETLNVIKIGELQRVFVFEPGDPLRRAGAVHARELADRKVAVFPRGANPALFDATFRPLIDAKVELVPMEFDGHLLAEGKRSGPLVLSYFGNPAPDAQRGERLLAESEPISFNFVTRSADQRPMIEAARSFAQRIAADDAQPVA